MAHLPAHTSSTTRNASETAIAFDVSVIIVTYNVREFLAQALDSVADASRGLTVETFVVDNDSADGSAEMVRTQYPDVHLIANEENVGFATANNQAIRRAAGRYLLILNPDTLLQEDTLRELVAYMDAHPNAGATGCRILNPDGTFAPESRRAFPTPAVAFYRISGLGKLFPSSPRFGRYNLTFLPRDEDCEVDALSGSCMMVRRNAVLGQGARGKGHEGKTPFPSPTSSPQPAGLLDEDYFMYGEDLDWCYRIQQAGWSIRYTPSTQIVHYKGESTKKGDLRYVILFYGAMLRFVEKHLAHQPDVGVLERTASRALALALRAGIVVRAGFAALRRLGRHISAPLTDGGLAWGALAAVATAWSLRWEGTFDPAFYAIVLPLYAAVLVLSTGLLGGYRGERRRLRSVWLGAGLAFLVVSTLSFFAPAIAFSRATLLIGYALAALVLTIRRAGSRATDASPTRTLVVGSSNEALRLQRLLGGHLRPALEIVGYVSDTASSPPKPVAPNGGVPHLGPTRQLRDLVRLWDAQEVVFAADSLTNTAILDGMRSLSDRPVRLKILASGRDQVIGKASVEDLSAPLLDAERAVAPLRSSASRRALEIPVALVTLLLSPVLRLVARLGPPARRDRMTAFTSSMRQVLTGRIALVGYHDDDPHPPAAWGLQPAVISVLDTLPVPPRVIVDAHRAYWFYARHQSAWLDLEVMLKALVR
ncbi:MAG: glycosyltransferase [Rubricoccaceae bacterium]